MREILIRYINSYENLTPNSISDLINCLHKNFVFVDPFNTIKGKENFELFLEKMFSRIKNPKFKIKITLKKKHQVLIKWNFKCLALRNKIDFNEPMDAIVYGTLISLGFATYENYTYVYEWAVAIAKEENFSAEAFSYLVALGRSYSAIPLHGFNGAVMGYYFGMYAFTGNKNYLVLSLALPYLFHGFYNYLLFPNSMIIIVILVIFSLYLHKDLRKKQQLKKKEKEQIQI